MPRGCLPARRNAGDALHREPAEVLADIRRARRELAGAGGRSPGPAGRRTLEGSTAVGRRATDRRRKRAGGRNRARW